MQKRIGLIGSSQGDNAWGINKHYLNFASQFGCPHILMPQEEIRSDLDLLILPGGADIHPSNYGEAPGFYTSNTDVFKEAFYRDKLQGYIENGTPVLGICLGHQALNVYFGGKLTQNLWGHPQSPERFQYAHEVEVVGSGNRNRQPERFWVNSHHHQGVYLNQLAPGLIPTLFEVVKSGKQSWVETDEDKILVEGFRHENLPIVGYAAHPEELPNPFIISEIERIMAMNEVAA